MSEYWQSKVYKNKEKSKKLGLRDVLNRDNCTCRRCNIKFDRRYLSVHHLTSRANGGSDDPSNLITLCNSCHDYVESNDLKSITAIVGSYEEKTVINDGDISEDWHSWVYGGAKNPKV